MKFILLIFVLVGCTQKYKTYPVVDKNNFNKEEYQAPITPKLRRTLKQSKSFCEGQIFFSSNAKTMTDNQTRQEISYMCPDSNYLMDAKITDTWWTTIIYSRSCVDIEAFCTKRY